VCVHDADGACRARPHHFGEKTEVGGARGGLRHRDAARFIDLEAARQDPHALSGADAKIRIDRDLGRGQGITCALTVVDCAPTPRHTARAARRPMGTRTVAAIKATGTPNVAASAPAASAVNGRFPSSAIW